MYANRTQKFRRVGKGAYWIRAPPTRSRRSEADRLCGRSDEACAIELAGRTKFDHGGGRRTSGESDTDPHPYPAREQPWHTRRDGKQQGADKRSGQSEQHRFAAADIVRNVAEENEHRHNDDRINREDRRRDGEAEIPFGCVERIRHRRRSARPKGVAYYARRYPEACTLSERS